MRCGNLLIEHVGPRVAKLLKNDLGMPSAPSRSQVGPRPETSRKGTPFWVPFWPKLSLQGSILGPQKNRKSLQNHTFKHRLARGPSKNCLWNGALKKHEKLMRKSCKNHPKTMPKVIRKSIKFKAFLKKLKLSKCFVLQYFFMFFQMKALRKSM